MKGISISTPSLESATRSAANLVRSWQVDQVLKIRAETGSNTAGQLIVRIGNLKVAASTPFPIKAGESFSARIQSLGQVPVLKIISTLAGPERAVTQFLREALPKQGDFEPLLQKLVALGKTEASLPRPVKLLAQAISNSLYTVDKLTAAGRIKAAITDSGVLFESKLANSQQPLHAAVVSDLKAQLLKLRTVIEQQLDSSKLPVADLSKPAGTGETGQSANRTSAPAPLQQAMSLFTDGKLSLTQLVRAITLYLPEDQITMLINQLKPDAVLPRNTRDLPESLFQMMQAIQTQGKPAGTMESLLALLRNTLALQELQQLTESALNRIQVSQLSSVARDTATGFLLLLDLPVRQGEDVQNTQLQFEKGPGDNETGEQWTVTINFNLPELGPIQARLRLQENSLVTRFEADRQETVTGIRENLPRLQQALVKTGLSVDHLSVEQGRMEKTIPLSDNQHLLDETV